MLTDTTVRDLLRHCYDPAIPLNIVDLGLVQSIAVTPDPDAPGSGIAGVAPRCRVLVQLLSTSDDEGAQIQVRVQAENLLSGLEQVSSAKVELAPSPAWTPARISPEGRRLLKLDATATPFAILNNRLR